MALSVVVVGGGVAGVTVMDSDLAAVAELTVFCAMPPFADSTPLLFTARTVKYQVPVASAGTMALVAFGSVTAWLFVSDVELLPNRILKLARSVSALPSVFVVGGV